jgi:hypothetical protein
LSVAGAALGTAEGDDAIGDGLGERRSAGALLDDAERVAPIAGGVEDRPAERAGEASLPASQPTSNAARITTTSGKDVARRDAKRLFIRRSSTACVAPTSRRDLARACGASVIADSLDALAQPGDAPAIAAWRECRMPDG